MKKLIIFLVTIASISLFASVKVDAAYNYAPWGESIVSAQSMSVPRVVDNSNFVDVNNQRAPIQLGDLRDIKVYNDRIYVSDATNNKIIILNEKYEYLGVFPTRDEETHKLNSPQGIFIQNDIIYIADSNNNRVVAFDLNTEDIVVEVTKPENEPAFEKILFRPTKVVVDRTGRLNVIAQDIFEGIMEFDNEGNFARYFGSKQIKMSVVEAILYAFASKSQKEKMALKLQTSFTSIDIDDFGYVYAVSRLDATDPVQKINFKGKNILKETGYVDVVGDAIFQELDDRVATGPSSIIDVTVHDSNNKYSILDNKRNRIFTYDAEGYLLYINGERGTQSDKLDNPTSLTYYGDNLLVTDSGQRSILVFEPTPFGELIDQATDFYYEMDYTKSAELWQEVLAQNSNYFLAYSRIGKVQIREGKYSEALVNLKLGKDFYNYSHAYEQHRNEKMSDILPYVLVVAIIGLGFIVVKSLTKAVQRDVEDES